MIFTETSLKGSYVIDLEPFTDERGWFARTYCKNEFNSIGHTKEWVQLNHSYTRQKGTIRGMHFQLAPFTEVKLVRCIAGAAYDVIIDIRKDSPTFLNYFGAEISAINRKMIYIPEGFAHGFQALTDECELIYHHSQFYAPGVEGGIRYNEPLINIDWPLSADRISERDSMHPLIDINFKGL
ncbi:dTDP-4-dehydrorhamnose 3,5-epimerase [Ferruginibacter paludis]|uniref:dTDP-4-dehydrorhamnose 3,5-epimerase n=1 Tax=Ferruginibacter paludis TaxID=1310417 RepID=UPI0025B3862D|nr:dTDP-4-dehydrorhamnose 3,5-epimerase [Ferruginibacter paludis]MDN3657165.1 dTDP-4-dehydrorhamnose 3,5-epimerase [Ferruginibacter paludis]